MRQFLKCYFLCLLLINLAACSTMQPVNVERAMQSTRVDGIDYGSLVEVRTLDKKTVKFRVTDMTPDGLGGNQGFYRYEDMKRLRVEDKRANDDTWTYILGAVGVIALVALVANSDSVSVCSPSPCPE